MVCITASDQRLYYQAKQRAAGRGIKFLFSFENWINWWEKNLGPDWRKKRGRYHWQFCMARKRDKGSYSPENVECITHGQNCRDRSKHDTTLYGEDHPNTKLTATQVIKIFMDSRETAKIARQYGIHRNHVTAIKRKEKWSRITNKLLTPNAPNAFRGGNQATRYRRIYS